MVGLVGSARPFDFLLESVRWQSFSVVCRFVAHKKLITDIIRFVWGCLVSILSFAAVIGIVIWLLTL